MRKVVVAALVFYKRWISPMLPTACRFQPTCSEYMMQAVEIHGAGRGIWLGTLRLLRCHPFHAGGLDPVPPANPEGTKTSGTSYSTIDNLSQRQTI